MPPRFDLIDIVQTLQRRFRYILIISLIAAILAAIAYLMRSKKYRATATFFISNPLYVDRTNLFRGEQSQFIDYFGSENDVDKIVAIANSDSLARRVIHAQNLGEAYKLDASKQEELAQLVSIFHSKYEAKRTENSTMDISYTDVDPKRAAAVANEVTNAIAAIYSGYYSNIRSHIEASLQKKIRETDSAIVKMTDTLSALRERFGIYDIISPSRKNMISGSLRSTGAGFGRAMEDIQTIEATKDQLVINRAEYLSVINEFNTSRSGDMPLVQVLNRAYPPHKSKDFGLMGTIVLSFLVALFFSSLWILLVAYFRVITTTERA
jgi:capsular polysaccharide biosynthesis protein